MIKIMNAYIIFQRDQTKYTFIFFSFLEYFPFFKIFPFFLFLEITFDYPDKIGCLQIVCARKLLLHTRPSFLSIGPFK